jgi:hypothetical protein
MLASKRTTGRETEMGDEDQEDKEEASCPALE